MLLAYRSDLNPIRPTTAHAHRCRVHHLQYITVSTRLPGCVGRVGRWLPVPFLGCAAIERARPRFRHGKHSTNGRQPSKNTTGTSQGRWLCVYLALYCMHSSITDHQSKWSSSVSGQVLGRSELAVYSSGSAGPEADTAVHFASQSSVIIEKYCACAAHLDLQRRRSLMLHVSSLPLSKQSTYSTAKRRRSQHEQSINDRER